VRWYLFHWIVLYMLFCTGLATVSVRGGDFRGITMSTIKTRPLSLGGAFISVEDQLAAIDFNPAAFRLHTSMNYSRFAVYFNPLGPALMVKNKQAQLGWETYVAWVIRGAALSVGRFRFGFVLGEENLNSTAHLKRSNLLDAAGYDGNNNSSIAVSVALASRVSLGIAGEFFVRERNGRRRVLMGYRYGVLLKARNTLNIGLCFIDFPNEYKEDRMAYERLADETLNIGLSYTIRKFAMISLDIRNVSDEGKGAIREPHIGLEFTPIHHLTIRGGYFLQIGEDSATYSLGVGIFDWNALFSEERSTDPPSYGLNAAFLYQKDKGAETYTYMVTLLARL